MAVIAACLIGSVAAAQPIPEPRMLFIGNGILCDTQEDLEVYMTMVALNGGNFVEEHNTSCGMFSPEMAVPLWVTPIEWYELPEVLLLVASYHHIPSGWMQYGYIALLPNPNHVALPQGDPA